MKMFLLRTTAMVCQDCGQSAMVMMRAENEKEAREMTNKSNSSGSHVAGVDWTDVEQATCHEFPLLDGPKGIVVGSWFDQHLPG